MSGYALIKDGTVINTVDWDGETEVDFGDGVTTAILPDGVGVEEGYTYSNGEFTAPPLTEEQIAAEAELEKTRNSQMKQYLMNEASEKVSIYQDAVDLDIATDAEKAALPLWKNYRVLLNRVDAEATGEIQWPDLPSQS